MFKIENGYQPRKGDVLVLHGVVKHDFRHSSGQVYLDVEGHYTTLSLALPTIIGIHSLMFEQDDDVILDGDRGPFKVITIHGEHAWIALPDQAGEVVLLSRLTRYTPPAEPEAPPAEGPGDA